MNHELQERDLLMALRQGDERAFEKIYQLYSLRLFGKLMNLVKSEAQAKDILQEVFLKLWEHRQSIDLEKSFRSYLFKITENKVYDFFRQAARDKIKEQQLILSSTTDYSFIEYCKADKENLQTLNKAIDELPPQRKQIFSLCKLEGKSYKEVSELLNISVSTISDHIVKGTKSVRKYFDNYKASMVAMLLILSAFNLI